MTTNCGHTPLGRFEGLVLCEFPCCQLPAGSLVLVSYWDHASASVKDEAKPVDSEAVGFFVENDTNHTGRTYIKLSMDRIKLGELSHPYFAILYTDITNIQPLGVR